MQDDDTPGLDSGIEIDTMLPNIIELAPGIYGDTDEPHVIILNVGEVLYNVGMTDTQQARASIWAAFQKAIQFNGGELVLIHEEGVPSIEEVEPNGPDSEPA